MNKKINIGYLTYIEHSAVNYYRCLGPLKEIHRCCDDINVVEMPTVSWTSLVGLDAVFFMKPYIKDHVHEGKRACHLDAIKIIKANRKPLILEYDDLLCEVPEESKFHRVWINEPYKENFLEFINYADGLILSTQYMADYLIDNKLLEHKNYKVVNNAINNYLLGFDYSFSEYNKTVLWRGTSTHFPDFEPYIEQLISIMKDNLDFTFIFMGICPDKRIKALSNTRVIDPKDIVNYHNFIKTLRPSIMYVPLLDTPFNRAKSNCSKLEATYAGAITLSPDFPEFNWKDNTGLSHFDTKDFAEHLDNAIDLVRKKDEIIKSLFNWNYNHVKDHYLLRDRNIERANYIKSVVKFGG